MKTLKTAYEQFYTKMQELTNQFEIAIAVERKILRKKIAMVSVLIALSCTGIGVSVWQIVVRTTSQFGVLVLTTILLLGLAVLLSTIMISDIRQHRKRLAEMCVRFENSRQRIQEQYKNAIENIAIKKVDKN